MRREKPWVSVNIFCFKNYRAGKQQKNIRRKLNTIKHSSVNMCR